MDGELNEMEKTSGMILNMGIWKKNKKRTKARDSLGMTKEERNKIPHLIFLHLFSSNEEILVERFLLIYLWFGPRALHSGQEGKLPAEDGDCMYLLGPGRLTSFNKYLFQKTFLK